MTALAPSSYENAIAFLYGRINYEQVSAVPYQESTFKLDRMHRLMDRLGCPHEGIPVVHVAGTKGKGSTASMIAAVLTASGLKTALYTSPHLESLEERFAIDGVSCSSERLVELTEQVRGAVEFLDSDSAVGSPTYFEITTAMALLHFAEQAADVMVLEVGLGGRLDSTNICTPCVSVITNVSYDHTKQLGTTLDRIAREKAGIIKPGIPVVSGVDHPEARQVIEETASRNDAALYSVGDDFQIEYAKDPFLMDEDHCFKASGHFHFKLKKPPMLWELRDVELGLRGKHQADNAAVALTTLAILRNQGWKLSDDIIHHGLRTAQCPARIEIVAKHPWIVLDTAHNVASIDALVTTLAEIPVTGRRRLVFATSGDKDVIGILSHLLPAFDDVMLTRFVSNPRSVDPGRLAEIAADLSSSSPSIRTETDPVVAWGLACDAAQADDLLCITGSFFLAAELREEVAKNRNPR